MKAKIIVSLFFVLSSLVSSLVVASPLTIEVDRQGCPTSVPGDGSCPQGEQSGAVCVDSGALVQWISAGNPIESIYKKPNSPGELRGCVDNRGTGVYQCAAVGTRGTHIDYNIQLAECPEFDPTIIIK